MSACTKFGVWANNSGVLAGRCDATSDKPGAARVFAGHGR